MLAGVPWTLTPSTCSGILFVRVSLDSRRAVLSVHVCISIVCSETFISYLPQLNGVCFHLSSYLILCPVLSAGNTSPRGGQARERALAPPTLGTSCLHAACRAPPNRLATTTWTATTTARDT
eukprot:scaffold58164_cov56-Phaeocystis_antarctica.AAC.2